MNDQWFFAPVIFPQGAVVNKLTLYAYKEDIASLINVKLIRVSNVGVLEIMAEVEATWTDGEGSGYDDTVSYAQIDNETYSYSLYLSINPNDSVADCYLRRVQIEWR